MKKYFSLLLNHNFMCAFLFLISLLLFSGDANAACSNPSGAAGDQMYNSTHNVMQFCDGTHWTAMKGDGTGGAETDPQVGSVTNGQICRGTGSAASCNISIPSCVGQNKALQFTGSAFSCTTLAASNASCPATTIKDGSCQTLSYPASSHNAEVTRSDPNDASGCSGDYYGTFTKKCVDGSWYSAGGTCNYQSGSNSCYCTGGCSCFIAGTMVTLANGAEKAIEEIVAGDIVLGMDGQHNTVTGVEVPPIGERVLYAFNGGNYFVTREHPFMLDTGQWASINPDATEEEQPGFEQKYGKMKPLEVGDTVALKDGEMMTLETIESRGRYTKTMPVYNLLLDGNHTYYADGFLVHNKM